MKKLKELLSDTLVYGISSVLARFVGYLLVPLHTDVFVESQYGIINLVYVTLAFLNVVFTFGMESAYLRYAKDREKAKDVFKTIQLGLGVLSTVLVGLLILCAPLLMPAMKLETTGSESLYWLMLGILWFDTMVLVPFAELRLVRKQWFFATLRTANIVLNVGLQFYLILWQGWGIEAVFFASFIASAITALVIWIATAQMFTGVWDTAVMKKALRFGLPFIPAGLGFVINEMMDRYFLEHYMSQATVTELYGADLTSLDIVGIYSACYKLSVFMLLLVQMFRMAWQPFFLRNADDPEAPKIYSNVFRYFNVVAGICFLAVALFAYQIVQIKVPFLDAYIIGKDYWAGLNIVPVLLGAYWFQGWYMNFSAGIFIKEETKTLPKITLFGAGITILFNLLLIPYYGMMGSAVATLISYVSMAFALYWKSRKVYKVPYQIGRSLLMVFIAAACVFAQPYFESWAGSFWTGSIVLLLVGTLTFVGLGLQGRQVAAT
ncbi:MAG: polysaccharide biosynthesis C-terminal domain-containing protein [Balneolaceae bacterium]|nr:polysaccharide biosynthesis C-terminal domain-containing protein [Balneolaceae bacterium]